MDSQPLISVIIPVHNGSRYLGQCLDALQMSRYRSLEIIVVDDASTDDSADVARSKGVIVLQLGEQSGPAAARNRGADQARGRILFFVDADVVVQRDTMAKVWAAFERNPDIAAVFGSYDNAPAEANFCSQYKNLYHHFVHQRSGRDAVTFWSGCGAIRRQAFQSVGGFDARKYPKPSIEDIELGYRLRAQRHRILLEKDLQAKHLKRWTFGGLLYVDILRRAVPWSKLVLENQDLVNDLNLKPTDRVSAGLVGASVALMPLSVLCFWLLFPIPFLLVIILVLNRDLYTFFFKQRGFSFTARAFLMQLLYYAYGGVTFVLCWFDHHVFKTDKQVGSL